ncbi:MULTISPECIES: type III-A CRISPR-associated RAMP protein Csm3 [unclassified Thermosipho (in: thermotogales)]|uniref:type III-A CRISPR-associated RAMP protein Csm3 n=1 Tax=unclassified Thermosipho (in: thermotogales) TaxID=2676525 RepID=UPI00098609B9|nr:MULTISPECIES: type III-A CRISPR-associated RAMP protein Csm3 [unclassified Thermosipho (in: thermotogales)]MBT1248362.1 type III-A CRISPR-associated RAMP protein Csm3 [Thermosipho sp. 1244]OOC47491.1 CRISPR-associated protein Csm3 [Thermosipho sp. 1223]
MERINFKGKFIVRAELVLLTGLHIGGQDNTMEIGGIDNPVIKDERGIPYIPGTSLKGKLRTLMEYYHEKIDENQLVWAKKGEIKIHMCDDKDCPVCNLFGRNHGKHTFVNRENKIFENLMPTRLIVRDSKLIQESITEEMRNNLDTSYTEVKHENTIDRITSSANPRQNERVPAGARFKVEFVINVYNDEKVRYLKELITAMKLLEDDYLGGSGSRGYGKVKFENISIMFRDKGFYLGISDEKKLKKLNDITEKIDWESMKIE